MDGAMMVSNEGLHIFHSPLTLPIFGNLDSYGRLENIERDANVECIEAYFKMSIDDFMEQISRGWCEDCSIDATKLGIEHVINPKLSGMFVNRRIYNAMTKSCPGEFRGSSDWSIWDHGDLTDNVLNLIGFKFVEQNPDKAPGDKNDKQRYNRLFTNPNFPTVEIWSDSTWIRCIVKGKKREEIGAYKLKDLVTRIEKATKQKFPDTLKAKLQKTASDSVRFDASAKVYFEQLGERLRLEELKKIEKPTDEEKRELEKLTIMLMYTSHMDLRVAGFMNLGTYLLSNAGGFFRDLYGDKVMKLKKLIVGFKTFERNMWATNRFYGPTTNHYQHGNHYGHLMITEETVKILKGKCRE